MPQVPTKAIFHSLFGGLAHLGERMPCKHEVTGSSPVSSTPLGELKYTQFNKGRVVKHFPFGAIAQLGEHLPCKQGVEGSSPSSSTGLTN